MAKKHWLIIIFSIFLAILLISIPVISIKLVSKSWIVTISMAIFFVVAVAITIVLVCAENKDKFKFESFITKEELERFKREFKECDKFAK